MDVAPIALASATEEFAQISQEIQDLEAKAWYETWIIHQQDPRPLKSTDAEHVELIWKLRAEQQPTAAQAGTVKRNRNGQNLEQKEDIRLILDRISCFELWTLQNGCG